MDQEIKISISKRSLTQYTISAVIVVLALLLGYRIGLYGKSLGVGASQKVAQAQIISTEPLQLGQHIVQQDGDVPMAGESSDASWSSAGTKERVGSESASSEYTSRYFDTTARTQSSTSGELSQSSESDESIGEGGDKGRYVASKNGTKYYPVGCKSAGRIKPENRVYFANTEEAELEGLDPSTTCK